MHNLIISVARPIRPDIQTNRQNRCSFGESGKERGLRRREKTYPESKIEMSYANAWQILSTMTTISSEKRRGIVRFLSSSSLWIPSILATAVTLNKCHPNRPIPLSSTSTYTYKHYIEKRFLCVWIFLCAHTRMSPQRVLSLGACMVYSSMKYCRRYIRMYGYIIHSMLFLDPHCGRAASINFISASFFVWFCFTIKCFRPNLETKIWSLILFGYIYISTWQVYAATCVKLGKQSVETESRL